MNDEGVAESNELKVAIVGAGPAGMYVADALLTQHAYPVTVDLYDRLPTPFGLLRYGVAPDHLKMKSLQNTLQRTLDDDRVRFVGGVEIGTDVAVQQLRAAYHAVVYSFGASTDRRMQVPGEELPGSSSAVEFVNWYSGLPDVPADRFRLDAEDVVLVGLGNVAVDVARVLVKHVDELSSTDIPQPVLDALAASRVRRVHIVGRRGPVQAKFTHKELAELGQLTDVDVVVDPRHLDLDPDSEAELAEAPKGIHANVETLREWANREPTGAPRQLHLHFWSRPVAVLGRDRVEAVRIESARPGPATPDLAPQDVPAQLVLRCVGYLGSPIAGVPVDPDSGTVPNEDGRVLRDGVRSPGEYAAGWIGRGAVGVLGTNRHHAHDVVAHLIDDAPALLARCPSDDDVPRRLTEARHHVVSKDGWSHIDSAEQALGATRGRARTKISTVDGLWTAADEPSFDDDDDGHSDG